MKRWGFSVLIALGFALGGGGLGAAQSEAPEGDDATEPAEKPKEEIAVIEIADMGTIRLRFFPGKARLHVRNFKKLATDGFYDGTTFHRVIPGFMIQGGDPNTKDDDPTNDGYGGPEHRLPAEFNDISHVRGVLSMARGPDPNSAGSQFFICVADATYLDRQYTAFGEVISGMEVADQIAAVERDPSDRPLESVVVTRIRIEEM